MLLEIRINRANAMSVSQLNNGYFMETGKKEVLKDTFGLKTQNCLMGRSSGFEVAHTQT